MEELHFLGMIFYMYDKNFAALFLLNFNEAYRSAKLLAHSYKSLQNLIPLTGIKISQLSFEDLDRLDAFRARFCDLQDSLGSKTFRSLLKLEEEEGASQLDVINKVDKRKIITSFEDWRDLREIRNLFSPDYPDSDEQRAQTLNMAHANTLKLIQTLDNLKSYVEKNLQLPMEQFPNLGSHG